MFYTTTQNCDNPLYFGGGGIVKKYAYKFRRNVFINHLS